MVDDIIDIAAIKRILLHVNNVNDLVVVVNGEELPIKDVRVSLEDKLVLYC